MAALLPWMAAAGCAPRQSMLDQPVSTVLLPAPEAQGGPMTVGELRQRLMTFADLAMGEMARASAAALATDSTPSTRAFAQVLQAQVAATSL
ncbi:MAG: hypothetical protein FJ207_08080 [Gemmatimonadetes bacterium]|nr:hypothetical protein [Gemmatimonadota bacterium]